MVTRTVIAIPILETKTRRLKEASEVPNFLQKYGKAAPILLPEYFATVPNDLSSKTLLSASSDRLQ